MPGMTCYTSSRKKKLQNEYKDNRQDSPLPARKAFIAISSTLSLLPELPSACVAPPAVQSVSSRQYCWAGEAWIKQY